MRGPTGSGKTMLAGLYARAGASAASASCYYGFEEPRAILLRNYRVIGMPMDELENRDLHMICRYPGGDEPRGPAGRSPRSASRS